MKSPRPSRSRRWLRTALALALSLVIALALLRVFCLRIFEVTTPSMEPTIHGASDGFPGEKVLVGFGPLFDRSELERFDLVVIQRSDGGTPLCKRLVGLPGDRLQFVGGDLLVNGARLSPTAPRPPWIGVFDQARDTFDEHFHYSKSGPWAWSPTGELELNATGIARGAELGMMLFQRELNDTVRRGDGTLDPGLLQVNDARLVLDFRLEEALGDGRLRFRLVEDGDRFEVELGAADGQTELSLVRKPGDTLLASAPAPELGNGWWRLAFENRDDQLAVELTPLNGAPDAEPLRVTAQYSGNRAFSGLLPEGISSIAPRVAFGGTGVRVQFRAVRIFRDVFWVSTGDWGSRPVIELGPNEYFAVGDNSANSLDSRHWGPLEGRELVGRPLKVLFPAATRRSL